MIVTRLAVVGGMAMSMALAAAVPATAAPGKPDTPRGVVRQSGFGCVNPAYSFTVGPGFRVHARTSDTTSKVTPSGNSSVTCVFHGPSSAAAHESSNYYDEVRHPNISGQLCLTPTGYTRDSTSTVVGRTLVLTCTRTKESAVPAQLEDFQSFRDGGRQYMTAGITSASPANPLYCPAPGSPNAPEACPQY